MDLHDIAPHHNRVLDVRVRLEGLEQIMATVADLIAAVGQLAAENAALKQALADLQAKPAGTSFSAEDQSSLDSAVSSIQAISSDMASQAAAIEAEVNPPAPAPEPAPAPVDASSDPNAG